jgi:hypothetical protein
LAGVIIHWSLPLTFLGHYWLCQSVDQTQTVVLLNMSGFFFSWTNMSGFFFFFFLGDVVWVLRNSNIWIYLYLFVDVQFWFSCHILRCLFLYINICC